MEHLINEHTSTEVAMQYGGSEMKKGICYMDDIYMMKFPDPIRKKTIELSYMNNQYSEYIGCKIFNSCKIEAQDTLLAKYEQNGINKIVVLCRDFTKIDTPLIEMATLVNADISSGRKKDLSVESAMEVIQNTALIKDKKSAAERFWDIFVIDTLIGNTDRHYGNWGFLRIDGYLEIAPVYDCGSSLGALIPENQKALYLQDEEMFKNREYNVISTLRLNGKKIFYHETYANPPEELKLAMLRVVPNIDLLQIQIIIDETPYISEVDKEYLIKSIVLRFHKIIKPAYNKVL